jgi:hypothetical protein
MYLPYDERLNVHPQDDDFLDLERWDFAGTPEENYPLLLHYHPLHLYRSQVIIMLRAISSVQGQLQSSGDHVLIRC